MQYYYKQFVHNIYKRVFRGFIKFLIDQMQKTYNFFTLYKTNKNSKHMSEKLNSFCTSFHLSYGMEMFALSSISYLSINFSCYSASFI